MMNKWFVVVTLFLSLLLVNTRRVMASEAMVRLESDKAVVKKGEEVEIVVRVETERETLGTDLVMKYDNKALKLLEVVPGEVYPNYSSVPAEEMSEGEVRFSGVADVAGNGVVVNGTLVKMRFKAVEKGEAGVEIVYEEGNTNGTGVIPFEGMENNLLDKTPEPLMIKVEGGGLLSIGSSGEEAGFWSRLMEWIGNLILN